MYFLGEKLLLIFQVEYYIIFGINVPEYPIITVEARFWAQFEICVFFVVNNNKYSSHVVENMIFGIRAPDYPIITVETTILG